MPDYGNGTVNIDKATGVRYGVIHVNNFRPDAMDVFTAEYPHPQCKDCHIDLDLSDDKRGWVCSECKREYWGDDFDSEPIRRTYEKDGYKIIISGDSGYAFVIKSPYIALRAYCSPCMPGAGDLMSEGDVPTYCLDEGWFDEYTKRPYDLHDYTTWVKGESDDDDGAGQAENLG